MSRAATWRRGARQANWPDARRLVNALRQAVPPVLFGVRLWIAVCLALYISFSLELDNAFWAGTSAAIVCQPHLGASLRKSWFRVVGTVVGAVAIVMLTATFPQNRVGFLLGLALWGGACAFVATLLRNFASNAAALAGFTAAVIASDQLGTVGGLNGQAFTLAITRVSEICIGIVAAGIVLLATDFGGAKRRLAVLLAAIAAEIMGRYTGALLRNGPDVPDTRPVRRELIRRVVALDPVIDETIGESSWLRYHSPIFQAAVDGLFAVLACWRTTETHLAQLPQDLARAQAGAVLQQFPPALRTASVHGRPECWSAGPSGLRRACGEAARALRTLPADTVSLRLLADQAAEALAGVSHALVVLALLVDDPARSVAHRGSVRLRVPDWLPAVINAGRALATIGVVALVWIVTVWPGGATAITFATITVIVFSPRAEQAYTAAMGFTIGAVLTAVLAAIVDFAVLPKFVGFPELCVALGLVMVPAGAFLAAPRPHPMFMAVVLLFLPLLSPANQMNYDPQQFYNTALAIVVGSGTGGLAFRLLPPLSPALRTRRLLMLTLRELRRLTTGPIPSTADHWEGRIYGRLTVLPEQAEPLQRAQLLAALSVGREIIRLRRVAPLLHQRSEFGAALAAVARGDSAVAAGRLAALNRELAAQPGDGPGSLTRLRARAIIVALSEALLRHAAYFNAGAGT
jgi:uncharacterized membrane protein YccC